MKTRILTLGCALAVVSLIVATPAQAAPGIGDPQNTAEGLNTPLGLAIDQSGRAYVSDNFGGTLSLIDKKGAETELVSAPGWEITAPGVSGKTVYYVQASMDHLSSTLNTLSNGVTTPLADIAAFEAAENPDAVNTYGFFDLTAECEAQFVPFPPYPPLGMPSYPGIIDTHAYASAIVGTDVYIADAGANAILKVTAAGDISALAVLPPSEPITVGEAQAVESNWPSCVIGHGYRTEPVPTDVELGPDGWLYVTTLPGGPEDPSLGARGSVYKVDPNSGATQLVATGFAGATNLAVAPNGTIFVAELFGGPTGSGQISTVSPGANTPTPLLELPMPATVSVRAEALYVTTNALVPDAAALTVVKLKGMANRR